MDPVSPADLFLFERFRFNRRGGGLFRLDDGARVAVGSRALDVLSVLIERAGDLVSKDEIMEAVWPGMAVEDANLTVQISALRRVLDLGRSEGSCIQTVAMRGYRFIAVVTQQKQAASFGNGGIAPHGPGEVPEEARPVGVYTVPAGPVAALPNSEVKPALPPTRTSFPRRPVVTVAVAGLLIIAGGLWLLRTLQMMPSATVPATPVAAAVLPAQRLSIVVTPFRESQR
jgi:DNA-binding winged helix-turn-helix (wHTH) protein